MNKDWEIKQLGEVAEIGAGNSAPQNKLLFVKGIYPFFRTSDVGKVRIGKLYNAADLLNDEGIKKLRLHPAGTILIPKSGASTFLNHRVILGVDGYVSSHLATVFANNECIESGFLLYYLMGIRAQGLIQDHSYPSLNLSDIKNIPIPIPPLPEQKRIVAILDRCFEAIDKAKANVERNLQNAKDLFQSRLNELFAKADNDVTETTVAGVTHPSKGSIRTGPFGSQLLHGEFVDEGIAVLGIDNAVNNEFQWGARRFITQDKYESLSRYRVVPGDVLITIMGTCGRCAVVPDDIPLAINSKHICCITLDQDQCLPEFLHAYFLYHPTARQYLSKRAKGSIMSGLNMGIIKELPLLLPSTGQQRKIIKIIAAHSSDSIKLTSILLQKLKAFDELKKSLLQKTFNGELTETEEAA